MTSSTAEISSSSITAKLFRGLGDESRLAILQSLCGAVLTVSEIVDATGLGQSNVSNHLRCLADCGLVVGERDGKYVRYELSDGKVAQLLELAEDLLSDVAGGVVSCQRYEKEVAVESDR